MPEGSSPSTSASSAGLPAGQAGKPKPPTPPALPAETTVQINAPTPPLLDDAKAQAEIRTVLQNEPLTIWTMQDDIRALRDAPGGRARPPETTSASAADLSATQASKPASQQRGAPVVPLPPKNASQGTKVVMKPARRRRRRSRAVAVLIGLLVLVMAGSAAVVGWFYQNELPFIGRKMAGEPVPAEQVVPAMSAVILQYHLRAGEERGELLSAWNAAGRGEPSLTSLLAGDPRLLLLEAEIDTFYYVVLENEARPYLVVRQTPRTQELVEGKAEARLMGVNGWYVVNALSVDTYTAALAAGSLSGRGNQVFVTAADGESLTPLRVWLGPHALIGLRETLLGKALTDGLLQEVSLASRLGTEEEDTIFELNGRGTTLEPLFGPDAPGGANQQLLSLIPEEAQLVRLGSNFYQDLKLWETAAGALDGAVLARPAVADLLQQLTESYAFYTVSGNPAMRDLGLIISLPAPLQAQLTVPNQTIEESLGALLPLITGRAGVGTIEFSPNTHAGVALHYANFSQPSQALDYAVVDTYIVVTTSRESMFAALETIRGTHPAVAASASWQPLLAPWGALPSAATLVLGQLALPQLTALLPVASDGVPLFGVALEPEAQEPTSAALSGLFVIPAAAP